MLEQQSIKPAVAPHLWLTQAEQLNLPTSSPSLVETIDLTVLQNAYQRTHEIRTKLDNKPVATDYQLNLQANLQGLLNRFQTKRYHLPQTTQPVDDIALLEDQILQQAVVILLEPLYRQNFLNHSCGHRSGRSAQQALTAMWRQLTAMGGGWLIELNIETLRKTMRPEQLRFWLQRQCYDEKIERLIDNWLQANLLLTDCCTSDTETQRPQSQLLPLSTVLLSLYLQQTLDIWLAEYSPQGAFRISSNKSAVLGFTNATQARQLTEMLAQYFGQHSMQIYPDSARLVYFLSIDTRL